MSVIAFSGSRDITDEDRVLIDGVLFRNCSPADEFVTGACIGTDQHLATTIHEQWPQAKQVIFVPHDRTRVDSGWLESARSWPNVMLVEMTHSQEPYRARNQAMVDYAERLIAFPRHEESHPLSPRSGTWMTIRMARKRWGVAYVHVLTAPEFASRR